MGLNLEVNPVPLVGAADLPRVQERAPAQRCLAPVVRGECERLLARPGEQPGEPAQLRRGRWADQEYVGCAVLWPARTPQDDVNECAGPSRDLGR